MITNDNIEIWILRYKDGELNATENAMVEKALAEHPEWQELADLYDPSLLITDDDSVVFPHKEQLHFEKSTTVTTKRKIIPLWSRISAAACIALLLGIGIRHIFNEQPTETYITAKTTAPTVETENGKRRTDSRSRLAAKGERRTDSRSRLADKGERRTDSRSLLADKGERRTDSRSRLADTNAATNAATEAQPIPYPLTEPPTEKSPSTLPVITDKLIAYLDDDDNTDFHFSKPETIITDKLITFFEDDQPELEPWNRRRTKPQFAEDMIAEMQLASLQFQTSIANKLLGNQ